MSSAEHEYLSHASPMSKSLVQYDNEIGVYEKKHSFETKPPRYSRGICFVGCHPLPSYIKTVYVPLGT